MSPPAVFAYGSLVSRASVAETLGHDVAAPVPASLAGWRRRWSLARDNHRAEKSFESLAGERFDFCLGLNLERDPEAADEAAPNGALVEVTAVELERLDRREIRYQRIDVTDFVHPVARRAEFAPVFAFTAKPEHFAAHPPPRAVVLAAYLRACEAAFEALGPDELAGFAQTTEPVPVPVVEARLVRDEIPAGNPRAW